MDNLLTQSCFANPRSPVNEDPPWVDSLAIRKLSRLKEIL